VRRLEADTISVYVSNGTVLMHQTLMQKTMSTRFDIDATLIAGHAARLHAGALSLEPFSASDATCQWAWRRGKICFSGQTLSDAVAEVNRYRERQLVIDDPALSNLQVGGGARFQALPICGMEFSNPPTRVGPRNYATQKKGDSIRRRFPCMRIPLNVEFPQHDFGCARAEGR
jgi:hypothetical protein